MFKGFGAGAAAALCMAWVATPIHAHGGHEATTAKLDYAVQETARADGILEPGEAWFWNGTTLDGSVRSASFCDQRVACPTYQVAVASGAARLRIGIDTPERTDTFVIELFDPDGNLAASDSNANQFNSEVLIPQPAGGVWTVRVRPESVTHASYRLRAKLETVLPEDLMAAGERRALLPNLRTVPPLEFTFVAPANPLNGLYPPDTINPPLQVGDIAPLSCTADEMAPPALGGGGARRCLRFTSGPINLGPGIYDMRFSLLEDAIAGTAYLNPQEALSRTVVGPKLQAVHYSDGSEELIPAGTYSFHPIHFHFHDDYVLSFELYAVTDADHGGMVQAGLGTKSGFCPADQLFGNWAVFNQGYETPGGDTPLDNCSSPINGVLGLSVGWGDVYRWQRPGMYVEFADQPNGRYVVRSLVDAQDRVIETNNGDNVSYAYIDVQGDTIEILERGWGKDPWDPDKVVFKGPGPVALEAIGESPSVEVEPTDSGSSDGGASDAGGGAMPGLLLLALAAALRRRAPRH
ncbi:MAG TPA: PPC domain-containing protein [Fontimonas sp.]